MPKGRPIGHKKHRTLGSLPTVERFYIFCEGAETEPDYFQGFRKAIASNPLYSRVVTVKVEGLGQGALQVVKAAEKYADYHKLEEGQIWCVYDKDDVSAEDFNQADAYAKSLNQEEGGLIYRTAWSNPCFEYWVLLHFQELGCDQHRNDCIKKLHPYFRQDGKKAYQKNQEDLFAYLNLHGDPKEAIRRAGRHLAACDDKSPAASAPATQVHLLVQALAAFLPKSIQERYI